MPFDLDRLVRPNIQTLVPYSSARNEFTGTANVYLDANENSYGSPLPDNYNRYPDPLQVKLKGRVAELNGLDAANVFVGHGSDEAIDLLIRIFCTPGKDEILVCPPTYGMYEVSAAINDVRVVKVPLTNEYAIDVERILDQITGSTKLIFLCSPNNPTGNSIPATDMLRLAAEFAGIVVVDEAYINFARQPSLVPELANFGNLVILQTLSKAWGLAALRIGFVFAAADIIKLLNAVKPPYNISRPTQELALIALEHLDLMRQTVRTIIADRKQLAADLTRLDLVQRVYPSDANFLLVRVNDADRAYKYLLEEGIVVRNRSNVLLCEDCLRITVGTSSENELLLEALKKV